MRDSTAKKDEIKRRGSRMKDSNAPKPPATAYVLYLRDKRNSFELLHKDTKPEDVNAAVAASWKELPEDKKQFYHNRANLEREQFVKEVEEYKRTDQYKTFQEKRSAILLERRRIRKSNKKWKTSAAVVNDCTEDSLGQLLEGEVPIFSPQFLEFNKAQEVKLRKLRSRIADLEEESKLIRENITRLKANIELMKKKKDLGGKTSAIEETVAKWTKLLVDALGKYEVVGITPTSTNIDVYMSEVAKSVKEDPKSDLLKAIAEVLITQCDFT